MCQIHFGKTKMADASLDVKAPIIDDHIDPILAMYSQKSIVDFPTGNFTSLLAICVHK